MALAAYREKDRNFVRMLLIEEMINTETLIEKICMLKIEKPLNIESIPFFDS